MLQIQLHGPVGKTDMQVESLTSIVSGLSLGTAIPGGFSDCSFSLALSERDAFEWYATRMGYGIHVHEGEGVIWEGRVESVSIRPYGADVTCVGYWSALTDNILYQWWADDRPSQWKPATLAGEVSPGSDSIPEFAQGSFTGSGSLPLGGDVTVGPTVTIGADSGGLLAAIGNDASPRETSRRVDGTWDTPISVTGTTGDESHLRLLTDQLWFTINDNQSNPNAFGYGPGSRSKDGGDTWAATPQMGSGGGLRDIARAVDGRLWCIVHDTDATYTRTAIYYSDDDGDTWVLSTTHGTGATPEVSYGWRIACHPTDKDIIAIVGFAFDVSASQDGYILFTTDQGAGWTVNFDVSLGENFFGFQYYHDMVILSTGRLIIVGLMNTDGLVHKNIIYTDDFGVTLTNVYDELNDVFPLGIFVSADELTIAVAFGDSALGAVEVEIWLSTDSGSTFARQTLATELTLADMVAMASSPDIIYIGTGSGDVYQLTPVSAAGVWTQIDAGFPHALTGDSYLGVSRGSTGTVIHQIDTNTNMLMVAVAVSENKAILSVQYAGVELTLLNSYRPFLTDANTVALYYMADPSPVNGAITVVMEASASSPGVTTFNLIGVRISDPFGTPVVERKESASLTVESPTALAGDFILDLVIMGGDTTGLTKNGDQVLIDGSGEADSNGAVGNAQFGVSYLKDVGAAKLGWSHASAKEWAHMQLIVNGSGNKGEQRIGTNFQPKVAVVKAELTAADSHAMILIDGMPTAKNVVTATGNIGIKSLNPDGFTSKFLDAPGDGVMNKNGTQYHYYAIGGPDERVKVGTYVGTAAELAITGLDFAPEMVWTLRMGAAGVFWKIDDMGADTFDFDQDPGFAEGIKTLDSDGFTLGTGVKCNASGITYYYVAFAVAPNLHVGTYTGDAIDDRVLPATRLVFDIELAHIKANSTKRAVFKTGLLTGDVSLHYGDGGSLLDAIASGEQGAGTSLTYSHTVGDNDHRFLLVFVGGNQDVTGVTYNGAAMTFLAAQAFGINTGFAFYLKNPDIGAHDVVVTVASSGIITASSVSYEGVSGVRTPYVAQASSNSSSITVTDSEAGDIVVDFWTQEWVSVGADFTVGAGQTIDVDKQDTNKPAVGTLVYAISSEVATGVNTVMSWTSDQTDDNWHVAVALIPITTGMDDIIQDLKAAAGQFQIGTHDRVNESAVAMYFFAYGLSSSGVVNTPSGFFSNYKFVTDNTGGILVAPLNESFLAEDAAAWFYGLPFIINATQDTFWQQPNYIKEISFSVSFFNSTFSDATPTAMFVEVWTTDDFQAGTWSRAAIVASSGTYTYQFAGSDVRAILLRIGCGNTSTKTYAQPVGDARAEIYPLKLKAAIEALTPHEVVTQNIVGVSDLLPQHSLLRKSPLFINPSGDNALSLSNLRYEEATLQEIINALSRVASDSATETWYPAVWEGRYLHFKPIDFTAPPKWRVSRNAINDGGLSLERSLATYWSHVRAFFKDDRELLQTVRLKTDPIFSKAIPVERKFTLDAGAVPLPEAMRDAFHDDFKVPQPRAEIAVSGSVIGPGGASEPLFLIRAGDIIQISDLFPARNVSSASRDPLRTFIVRETSYDAAEDTITLSLEWPTDRLDTLLANIEQIVQA